MKIAKISLLLVSVTCSYSCFGKTEIDTITNWQVYKDSKLLFKCNELESGRTTARIKTSDKFKSLDVYMFYDFLGGVIDRKIELVCEGKILTIIKDKNDCHSKFEIPKKEIKNAVIGKINKEILIKYFDKIYPNGIVLGSIIFIEK